MSKKPLTDPIAFVANVWKQGNRGYFIYIDKDIAEKYELDGLKNIRVILDPRPLTTEYAPVETPKATST